MTEFEELMETLQQVRDAQDAHGRNLKKIDAKLSYALPLFADAELRRSAQVDEEMRAAGVKANQAQRRNGGDG